MKQLTREEIEERASLSAGETVRVPSLTDDQIIGLLANVADELDATRVHEMRNGKWSATTIFEGDAAVLRFARMVLAAAPDHQSGASSGASSHDEPTNAAARQWISVEERLPDYGVDKSVLVAYANGGRDVLASNYVRMLTEAARTDDAECYVTHWMPLPPPPGQDTPSRPVSEPDERNGARVAELERERDEALEWSRKHSVVAQDAITRAEVAEAALKKGVIRTSNCLLNKDMPCDRLKEAISRAESAEQTARELREALAELVRLKDLKDRLDAVEALPLSPRRDYHAETMREEYERCKPLAWEAARAAIDAARLTQGENT